MPDRPVRLVRSQVASAAAAAVIIACAVVLLGPAGQAQEAAPRAEAVLEKIRDAETATYQARQLVVYMGDPQSAAVLDVRSGRDGTFVRAEAGQDVRRLWWEPTKGVVSDDRGVIENTSPPFAGLVVPAILRKYAVDVGEPAMLLGVEVVPLTLQRRRDDALAERLWVHVPSGVVYRRELFDGSGGLVGMCTMLEMHRGAPSDARTETLDEPGRPEVASASADGDHPGRLPYGYTFQEGYTLGARDRVTEQWVYSDGLHKLSVFRTRGSSSAPDGFDAVEVAGVGAYRGPGPGTWMWEGGGYSWVVIAEESGLDAAELTSRFPRGGRSIWARMGSVWAAMWHGLVGLVD